MSCDDLSRENLSSEQLAKAESTKDHLWTKWPVLGNESVEFLGRFCSFQEGIRTYKSYNWNRCNRKKAILVEKQPSPGFSFILAPALFLNLPYYQPSAILFGLNLNFLMDFEIGFYSGFSVFWSLSLGLPSISSFFDRICRACHAISPICS